MYHRLDVDLVSMNVGIADDGELSITELFRGRMMPVEQAPTYRFTMNVTGEEDESGKPAPLMYSYFPHVSLMEKRLVETLQAAGVDNLQVFPAVIENERGGETIDNYVVVNVVGMVSCADLRRSRTTPILDAHYFHDLVIDPKKTRGLLLFRLAEQQTEILLHESVAKGIREGGFTGLVLTALTES